jgi:hypothetical protein
VLCQLLNKLHIPDEVDDDEAKKLKVALFFVNTVRIPFKASPAALTFP